LHLIEKIDNLQSEIIHQGDKMSGLILN